MADLLIKNMEMPKEGSITIKIRHDGAINFIGDMGSNLGRLVDCKAVALPEHGDLIQRDNLLEFIEKNEEVTVGAIYDFIQDAPTIVEATE